MVDFTLNKTIEFIPKMFNAGKKGKERISFTIKQPNYFDREKLRPIIDGETDLIDKEQLVLNIFDFFVEEIKNVSVQGEAITKENYEKLLSADGAGLLVIELVNKVIQVSDGSEVLPLSQRSKSTLEEKKTKP